MRDRLLRDGFLILVLVFVALRLFAVQPWADSVDAYAYWTTRDGAFYDAPTGAIGAYLYSPAFAQVIAPLVRLPLGAFEALWTVLNCATLWFLLRRWSLPSLLFVPIAFEIVSGNVNLLDAAAIVLGFRWSGTWALPILTKVTPGIGLLWFAVRREWRQLGIALGVTAAIALVSIALDLPQWRQWITVLSGGLAGPGGGSVETVGWYLPVALLPRLVLAAIVVVAAALMNRRWLLPVAVVLAMPVVWLNSLAVLAACPALVAMDRDRSSAAGAVRMVGFTGLRSRPGSQA